jgi:hypothetical protein
MKLTEFIEENQLDEEFLDFGYDMWGWIDPKGKVHLPTKKDAESKTTSVHHSVMITRWGFESGYYDAFSKGWIRWYLSSGSLVFNCNAMPNTVVALTKAVRQIEVLAKNPKKFGYFNGKDARRAATDPGGMLLIDDYNIQIDSPGYTYIRGASFSKAINELKQYMDQQGIEQNLKETTSGSVAVIGTGFASGGIGDKPLRRGKGVSVTGVNQKRKRVGETHIPGHLDHEVRMAHGELLNLAQNSAELYDMLRNVGEREGLPGWISSYITLANDYVESVIQYMREEQVEKYTDTDHKF